MLHYQQEIVEAMRRDRRLPRIRPPGKVSEEFKAWCRRRWRERPKPEIDYIESKKVFVARKTEGDKRRWIPPLFK